MKPVKRANFNLECELSGKADSKIISPVTGLSRGALVHVLSLLDASSLSQAQLVCREWREAIAEGGLWRKMLEGKTKCWLGALNGNIG